MSTMFQRISFENEKWNNFPCVMSLWINDRTLSTKDQQASDCHLARRLWLVAPSRAYNRPKEIIMFRVDFRFLCCNHILWYLVAKLYIGKRREVRQCSTWNCSKAKLCIRKFTRITQFASIKRWKIQFKKCKLFYCHRMYKPSSAQSV